MTYDIVQGPIIYKKYLHQNKGFVICYHYYYSLTAYVGSLALKGLSQANECSSEIRLESANVMLGFSVTITCCSAAKFEFYYYQY